MAAAIPVSISRLEKQYIFGMPAIHSSANTHFSQNYVFDIVSVM
jgi:hypothetical protein